MAAADTGLRFRIRRAARRIGEQHTHITQLAAELGSAVTTGSREGIREGLLRYQHAIEAHFSLEDAVFFPALHGLQPECAGELEALAGEHVRFRVRLMRLQEASPGTPIADFARALNGLVYDLAAHEAREERIFSGSARMLADDFDES